MEKLACGQTVYCIKNNFPLKAGMKGIITHVCERDMVIEWEEKLSVQCFDFFSYPNAKNIDFRTTVHFFKQKELDLFVTTRLEQKPIFLANIISKKNVNYQMEFEF